MTGSTYIAPTLTVDSIIFQIQDGALYVLLIQRANEPFKNSWALPGGYCAAGETTTSALERIMSSKAGINPDQIAHTEQLYTFDTIARDPRGHAVSVTYMSLGRNIAPELSPSSQNPTFFPVANLPELAYDHTQIIEYALERLQAKLNYTNISMALLPVKFTLSELQNTYEIILDKELDKRNFRKKFLSLDLIDPTSEMRKDGAHRPARLYKFKQQQLEMLARSFD